MRKTVLVLVGVGVAALSLTGCAPAVSGALPGSAGGGSSASAAPTGGSGSGSGSGSSGGSSATLKSGKIDMCTVFTAAALSAASGKTFKDTVETDSGDGVYGCAYGSTDDSFDWIVDVQQGNSDNNPAFDLGGPSAIHKVAGIGYPAVASTAGVDLTVGNDIVEVYTAAKAAPGAGTTDEFVKVAKAVIATLSK